MTDSRRPLVEDPALVARLEARIGELERALARARRARPDLAASDASIAVAAAADPAAADPAAVAAATAAAATVTADPEARHAFAQRLERVRRLEALAALAGGVAHDFNNLLTSVLGNTDLALAHLPPASPVRVHLKHIEQAARRAAELTRLMLACSGRGQFLVRPLCVGAVVRGKLPLIRALCPPRVTLEADVADDLPPIEGDADQIAQALMQVVTNAYEAIGDRPGTVRIAASACYCTRAELSRTYLDEQLPEGRYVALDITDTGDGMAPEIVARMFDPFFTTKFTGRGLGLAAALGILRGHRGAVRVTSAPGRGTTIRLLLPARPAPSTMEEAAMPDSQRDSQTRAGAGTAASPETRSPEPDTATPDPARDNAAAPTRRAVLVIDDEETVRGVAKTILERSGYPVLTASTGPEGVARFAEHEAEVGMVLLDMKLPLMSSRQVAAELRRLRPDVRIVLSSGYLEEEAWPAVEDEAEPYAGFLAKPYRFEDLLACVQHVLAGGSWPEATKSEP